MCIASCAERQEYQSRSPLATHGRGQQEAQPTRTSGRMTQYGHRHCRCVGMGQTPAVPMRMHSLCVMKHALRGQPKHRLPTAAPSASIRRADTPKDQRKAACDPKSWPTRDAARPMSRDSAPSRAARRRCPWRACRCVLWGDRGRKRRNHSGSTTVATEGVHRQAAPVLLRHADSPQCENSPPGSDRSRAASL